MENCKIAFVFPGQGAQYSGMGKSLYENYAAARKIYDICNARDINEISWHGAREDLTPTNIAQRAIFTVDLAAAMALKERLKEYDLKAEGAAGFSLGEIPALAYCGLMGAKDAYEFVCFRADTMHETASAGQGGMMAVLGLSAVAVEEICAKVEGTYPVNYNAPGQVVVAYEIKAEAELKSAVKVSSGKALPLAVAGAFHSPLMDAASAKIEEYLTGVKLTKPTIPLYSNVTGEVYGTSKDEARRLLSQQVNSPVRWQTTIENMISAGFDTFIETGPGKALAGMIKKIDKNTRTFSVFDEETLESCIENLKL
ncbi:MAG: ACP S-malonyltransferase [Defluviitaleaceae bacterium]|nr:ACP S-malonyltransferase [Defluviitaleaceae bacterium]